MSDQTDLFGIDASQPIAAHLDDTLIQERRNWPRDLVEIADFVRGELKAAGYEGDELYLLIEKVLVGLCFRSGGRGFYLPQADRVKRALRDKRLYDAFDGRNIKALVRKYGLSEQKVYEIIREQTALHRAKVQPGLF